MTVTDWLLDSDPSIRWQVMRDLLHEPAEVVAAERAKVATEGWGAQLLALQTPDGLWDGGVYDPAEQRDPDAPGQPWTATHHTLVLLRELGLDPASAEARTAITLVREQVKWDHAGENYFDGEIEPCVNGMVVALGNYFGENVRSLVDRLLGEQLDDGGWNCEAERGSTRSSFHTTICVLDGLLQHEQTHGPSADVTAARRRAEEYLLERRMLRRLSTGQIADPDFARFSFPTRWFYDVLRGLDYFRRTGDAPDLRLAEAIDLVESKRGPDDRWLLELSHPGRVHFELEKEAGPSRWVTLRALRIRDWIGGSR
ncbi:hypothetical protein [Mycetocola zhadangensis]|uniref:Squalene cyclase n=1 Tax=Mycetocola zhadangensis TaxID=1164595 RepID=A0A3L7J0W2_9MICO|nr:hypothetical protein [Mycetocola zhadangensis]RLQ84113.1 hypothetical protein D9V28_07725 [Mycetocola zhadangensis]GGE96041.1 hypothetical protein GCM10011313_18750 [Mycetocola zhadangensis]